MGILTIEDALENAQESGFDLIEISPNSDPPVCKLLDYGKVKLPLLQMTCIDLVQLLILKWKEVIRFILIFYLIYLIH